MLRIISGTLKGRKLLDSSKLDLRPTTDRNREALFNIINSNFELQGSNVLDLCAGTGAFAIEAISRGACRAICVEKNRDHANLLKKNADKLGISNQIEIRNADANNLSSLKGSKFDLIFIDPPYSLKIDGIIESLLKNELLAEDALVVTESGGEFKTELLEKIDIRKYGISWFGFFKSL